ncbi:hypothetical protein A3H83_00750 [Candidatus Roizmanbacteria bacterium RIFCSPLOWO2_02_FULL_39_8]|nr:MAG: hypothetical protein A3H83_00750 [Candidatus Roizmanbacteria bacterium RIFCSPLOWO2_02_FULL_39_8]
MNIKEIAKNISSNKKVKDYTYVTLFFLISSFFALFVIKPVISIAFSLQREEKDLRVVNDTYEAELNQLVDLQSQLEQIRDRIYLLDQALPSPPKIAVLFQSLKNSAAAAGVSILQLNTTNVNLVSNGKIPSQYTVAMVLEGNYDQTTAFFKELSSQRRIKVIKNLHILKTNQNASESAHVRLEISLDLFYL